MPDHCSNLGSKEKSKTACPQEEYVRPLSSKLWNPRNMQLNLDMDGDMLRKHNANEKSSDVRSLS